MGVISQLGIYNCSLAFALALFLGLIDRNLFGFELSALAIFQLNSPGISTDIHGHNGHFLILVTDFVAALFTFGVVEQFFVPMCAGVWLGGRES